MTSAMATVCLVARAGRPAGDNPEATEMVFIKEVWPPALGPRHDDGYDILDTGWRQ
jgi:hypothetical protein